MRVQRDGQQPKACLEFGSPQKGQDARGPRIDPNLTHEPMARLDSGRATDMEWGILAALLLIIGHNEPSREPRLIVLAPGSGPATRPAELGGEAEAGG